MSDYRPDWWPGGSDGQPCELPYLCMGLHTHATGKGDPLPPGGVALAIQCLSYAVRTWRSPSTPYDRAIYDLCLAAIAEAQARQEPTP
jgi:hypothetical protein